METILLYLIGVLVMVVGIGLSIAVHEAGHLFWAKRFNVRVTQFMIGFGKTIWSKKIGETEYGIKMIPLGGYCAMVGMYPPESAAEREKSPQGYFKRMTREAHEAEAERILATDTDRVFYRLPIYKRLIIMLGGIANNFLLAIVFIAITLMGFGIAQPTTTIGTVSQCVLSATSERQSCESGDPVAPGAAAGLQPGDRIIAINGVTIESWNDVTAQIQPNAGTAIDFTVERADGASVTVPVTPQLAERYVYDDSGSVITDADGEPETEEVGFVGIGPTSALVPQSISTVIPVTWDATVQTVKMVVSLPQRVVDVARSAFTDEPRSIDSPLSIVGVGRAAGDVAASSAIGLAPKVATLFSLIGSLNIALGVFNLIPLLPMDGGHAAGALWEGIRRGWAKLRRKPDPGPFDAAKLLPLTYAVAIVLIAMTAVLIYADLVKPINLFG